MRACTSLSLYGRVPGCVCGYVFVAACPCASLCVCVFVCLPLLSMSPPPPPHWILLYSKYLTPLRAWGDARKRREGNIHIQSTITVLWEFVRGAYLRIFGSSREQNDKDFEKCINLGIHHRENTFLIKGMMVTFVIGWKTNKFRRLRW